MKCFINFCSAESHYPLVQIFNIIFCAIICNTLNFRLTPCPNEPLTPSPAVHCNPPATTFIYISRKSRRIPQLLSVLSSSFRFLVTSPPRFLADIVVLGCSVRKTSFLVKSSSSGGAGGGWLKWRYNKDLVTHFTIHRLHHFKQHKHLHTHNMAGTRQPI